MPKRYAASTDTTVEKTRFDLESELYRFGAEGFGYAVQGSRAVVSFLYNNYQIRLELPLPDMNDPQAVLEAGKEIARAGRKRMPTSANEAFDSVMKQRWRALLLILKAKLVAITEEVRSFEEEFGWDIVLPNQQTVGQYLQPQLEEGRRGGTLPKALPGIGET